MLFTIKVQLLAAAEQLLVDIFVLSEYNNYLGLWKYQEFKSFPPETAVSTAFLQNNFNSLICLKHIFVHLLLSHKSRFLQKNERIVLL